MSQERTPVVVATTPGKSDAAVVEEIEAQEETRASRKARLAVALERGVVHERLKVDLPPDIHGEWVRNDPLEIRRLQLLGFRVDSEYAPKRSLHSLGDSSAIVGDTVHMICDRETKEIIDEINLDKHLALNSRGRREEQNYATQVRAEAGEDVPVFAESKHNPAKVTDVKEALDALARQSGQQI